MKRWLAALAMIGALACAAPAIAQTPGASPSVSPTDTPPAATTAEPAPPGIEISPPDFSTAKPEPTPPGFGEVRHYFDPLTTFKVPEDAHWAVPEPWTHGEVRLVWHSVGRWWIGGTGVTDVGYAVQVAGSPAYWTLDDDKIALFQVNGVLPSPMPKHETSLTNLLLRGYSLYILAAVVLLVLVVGLLLSARKPRPKV